MLAVPPSDEDVLILALRVNKRVMPDTLDAYQVDGQLFIPVSYVADMLLIETTTGFQSAPGTLQVKGKTLLLQSSTVPHSFRWFNEGGELYLSTQAAEAMLDASIKFEPQFQLLHLSSDTIDTSKLIAASNVGNHLQTNSPGLFIEDKYRLFTSPVVNYRLSATQEQNQGQFNLGLNAYNDILYHASEIRVNKTDTSEKAFFHLSRSFKSTNPHYNSPYWRYEMGDVTSRRDNLVTTSVTGAGFILNKDYGKTNSRGSSVDIEETALPGWRAELYRNNLFLDSVEVNEENRILFSNVGLFLGENHFVIKLYGPEGETETINRHYRVDDQTIEQNDWLFNFKYQEADKRLIDSNPSSTTLKSVAEIGTGVGLKGMSINAKVSRQEFHDHWQNYLSVSGQFGLQGGAFNWQLAKDDQSGHALYASYKGFLTEKNRFNFEYRKFNNFISSYNEAGSLVDESLRFQLSGRIQGFSRPASWQTNINRLRLSDGTSGTSLRLRGSLGISGGTIGITSYVPDISDWQSSTSNILWNKAIGRNLLSTNLELQTGDTFAVSNSYVEYRVARDNNYLFTRLGYQKKVGEDDWSVEQRFNWRHSKFNLSFGGRYSNKDKWQLSMSIFGSIGYDSAQQAPFFARNNGLNNGRIEATTFFDKNNNGQWDKEDVPLAGIGFSGKPQWANRRTANTGKVLLPNAGVFSYQSLETDLRFIENPFLQPDVKKVAVSTHAGGIAEVYIPVSARSDIEGAVYLSLGKSSNALRKVRLNLQDKQGNHIATTRSESDGYFLFSGVPPGQYTLEVDNDYLRKQNFKVIASPEVIDAPNTGDNIFLGDVLLTPVAEFVHETEPSITPEVLQNQYYIQLGVFRKARSIPVVMKNLVLKQVSIHLFREHKSGLSHILAGPYESKKEATSVFKKLRATDAFSGVFKVKASKFSAPGYTKEFQLLDLNQLLKTGHEHFLTSPTDSFFCQLASYQSVTSITESHILRSETLFLIERDINGSRYTLMAGPYLLPDQCAEKSWANVTTEPPLERQYKTITGELKALN